MNQTIEIQPLTDSHIALQVGRADPRASN